MDPIEGPAICLNGHVSAARRGMNLTGPFCRSSCPTCGELLYSANDPRLSFTWVKTCMINDIIGEPPVSARDFALG